MDKAKGMLWSEQLNFELEFEFEFELELEIVHVSCLVLSMVFPS